MRESGLKYKSSLPGQSRDLSLSMRESGLKSPRHYCTVMYYQVSLHAREWIEITSSLLYCNVLSVSLHAREWIEI